MRIQSEETIPDGFCLTLLMLLMTCANAMVFLSYCYLFFHDLDQEIYMDAERYEVMCRPEVFPLVSDMCSFENHTDL